MTRLKLLGLWLLIVCVSPILLLSMLVQIALGSTTRALGMAVAFDESGNCLFGGDSAETISRRTGLALLAGKRWARIVAPCIDFFFGKGHCLANAA